MSSEGEVRTQTLFVDLSLIYRHDSRTGIQRVVRSIWLNLREIHTNWEIKAVFASAHHGYCLIPGEFPDDEIPAEPTALLLAEPSRGDIFLGLDLVPRLIVQHENQLANWRKSGVAIAMVVYDLLALDNQRWFTRKARRSVSRWFDVVMRQADLILCISKTVAADVAQRVLSVSPPRIDTGSIRCIPLGAYIEATSTEKLRQEEEAWLAPLRSRRFALMVGTVEPRKGYQQVLTAYEHLWADSEGPSVALVIVGKPGWRTWLLQFRIRRHRENGRRLFWHSSASDGLLLQLYRECHFVIQASLAEGFGLPLVEALANGRPVLARDIPIFREVGNKYVTFFAEDNPITLSTAIQKMLNEPRQDISAPSHLMTWRQSAEYLLRALCIELRDGNIQAGNVTP